MDDPEVGRRNSPRSHNAADQCPVPRLSEGWRRTGHWRPSRSAADRVIQGVPEMPRKSGPQLRPGPVPDRSDLRL